MDRIIPDLLRNRVLEVMVGVSQDMCRTIITGANPANRRNLCTTQNGVQVELHRSGDHGMNHCNGVTRGGDLISLTMAHSSGLTGILGAMLGGVEDGAGLCLFRPCQLPSPS